LYTMSDSEDPLALINAIKNRNTIDEIRELISSGIDVNTQDKSGRTALMKAVCWYEHGAEMMRLLVDAKADVNKQEKKGLTALMMATMYGGEHGAGMVRLLVDAGAHTNTQNKFGRTALMYATAHGGEHGAVMIRLLVASGAIIPPVSKLRTDTPPELAGYIHGAQNWTPLHRAADARDADAIIKCLSEGMRPDAIVETSHEDMCTALSIAESTSYPTAQPVCDDCLALLRPSLVKGGAPSDSLFGGVGGGGGAQTET
jgi:hypothetical protein